METKMTKIILNDDVFSSIDKIHPAAGDVLIFNISTDYEGYPQVPLDLLDSTVMRIKESLKNYKDVTALFTFDKMCFENIKKIEDTIKSLEGVISYLREAAELAGGRENTSFPQTLQTKI